MKKRTLSCLKEVPGTAFQAFKAFKAFGAFKAFEAFDEGEERTGLGRRRHDVRGHSRGRRRGRGEAEEAPIRGGHVRGTRGLRRDDQVSRRPSYGQQGRGGPGHEDAYRKARREPG